VITAYFTCHEQLLITGKTRLESGLIYSCLLLIATVASFTIASGPSDDLPPMTGPDGLSTSFYNFMAPVGTTIIYQLCGIFAVSNIFSFSYSKGKLRLYLIQGILPTLMIVVVSLDLGVDTSTMTPTSFTPRVEGTGRWQRENEQLKLD
jgi:hypothetical protein